MRKICSGCIVGLLALATPVLAVDIDNPPTGVFSDEWYALMVKGHKSGHMHASFERLSGSKSNVIRSTSDMVMSAGRGGEINITISVKQESEETLDGRPLSFSSTQKIGLFPKTVSGVFKDGKVTVTPGQFGQSGTGRTYDVPKGAMMSWALYREQFKRGLKPGTKYNLLMYDPTTAEDRAIDATVEILEPEKIDLFGRTVEAIRTKQTVTIKSLLGEIPVETVTWITPAGDTVKMEMNMMSIPFEMLSCSKPVALAKDDPSDLMDHTLVDAKGKVDPEAKSMRYRITSTGGSPAADVPTTSMQRIESRSPTKRSMVLNVVRRSADQPTTQPSSLSDEEKKLYLAATPILNYKDPEVAKLVEQAAGDEKDQHKLLPKLREFVSEYIRNKNLSVGFATASEVARSREGDCTEHGVLLAALGRGVGIPTRLATGLVYVDEFNDRKDVFVGHLWTQFFVDGMWIDEDAALRQDDVDPTHIALSVNAATDSGVADLVGSLWLTMGQLRIEAIEPQDGDQSAK